MKIIPSYWLLHRMIKHITGQGPCRLDSPKSKCHIAVNHHFTFQLKVRKGLTDVYRPKKNYSMHRNSINPAPRCDNGELRISKRSKETILTAIARSGIIQLTEEQLFRTLKQGRLALEGTTVLFRKHGSGEVVAVGTIVRDDSEFLSEDWKSIPRKVVSV